MAEVDRALMEQVLHVAQRQPVLHVHHHHEADHFGELLNSETGYSALVWARLTRRRLQDG